MVDSIQGAGSTRGYEPSDAAVNERPREHVDPEMLIAELVSLSQRAEDASRATRRAMREQRRELSDQRFEAMKDAADARFVAGVAGGATQIGSAVAQYGQAAAQYRGAAAQSRGASATAAGDDVAVAGARAEVAAADAGAARAGATAGMIRAGGELISTTLRRSAEGDDIEAAGFEERAREAGELADEAAEDARRAHTREDRALQHLADLSQARMQALITASRG